MVVKTTQAEKLHVIVFESKSSNGTKDVQRQFEFIPIHLGDVQEKLQDRFEKPSQNIVQ